VALGERKKIEWRREKGREKKGRRGRFRGVSGGGREKK
jgi:hypothetical protein